MVLGVLTIMVLMAVAFSISMRTERAASGNYADSVKARQLIYVGLARAMEHIQTNMCTNLALADAQVYPEWGVTNSYSVPPSYTNTVDLLRGTASNYVPRAFWAEAVAANAADPSSHWINVQSDVVTNFSTNASGEVIGTNISMNLAGRVAYMIINCSGLVDANFAGGDGIERAQGTNPNEIAIEHLSEIDGKADFLADRAVHVRYETLHELTAVNSGLSFSTNLFIYSRFLQGYWTNDGMGGSGVTTGLNIIGLNRADLQAKSGDIKDAFREAVTTNDLEVDILYQNLLEYVDGDSEPEDIEQPYVDLFPMINEIVVSNIVWFRQAGGTNYYSVTNYVSVELWNPFVTNLVAGFKVNCDFSSTPLGSPLTPVALVPPADFRESDLPPMAAETFFVTNFAFGLPVSPFETNVTPPSIHFQAQLECEVLSGGDPRDGSGLEWQFVFNQPGNASSTNTVFRECLDPRFNWDPDPANGQWQEPLSLTHTLDQTNAWTLDHLDDNSNLSARTNDGCTAMYVKNGPLATVGELGYLAYAPWKTIRLCGTNAHKVLDVFAQSTNEVSRGLINPNTMVDDALAAAFAGMPVDEYPGGPASALGMPDAQILAGRIIDAGPYRNLSDVFRGLSSFTGLAVSVNTELKREAIVRNAAALLNLRQNLFTIIIEAHASKGSFIPGNPGKQRAVAVVWRDPYTGSCFLRSLKWLED